MVRIQAGQDLNNLEKSEMKNIALLFFIILSIFKNSDVYSAEWKTYDKRLFNIDYPSDWIVKEDYTVIISAPEGIASVSVWFDMNYLLVDHITQLPPNYEEQISLEEFVDKIYMHEKNSSLANMQNIKIHEQKFTKIAQKDAFSMVFSYKDPQMSGQFYRKEYVFLEGPSYYYLIYSGDEKSFDKYLETAEKMMNSFKPIPKELVEKELSETLAIRNRT